MSDDYEIEQKYRLDDLEAFRSALAIEGATALHVQQHRDTYYNHPCRDFATTNEALRVRRVDEQPLITYKGAKLASAIKTRIELEWPLGPGDASGEKTESLLQYLGFRRVAEVSKRRESFQATDPQSGLLLTITIDQVDEVGQFAEVECVATADQMQIAQQAVQTMAQRLGLKAPEPRSYLRMLLLGAQNAD